MNDSHAIVLQTDQKEHVGFVLIHPSLGASNGDCVFTVVPQKPELFEAEAVKTLYALKELGEHQWRWDQRNLRISFNGDDELLLLADGEVVHTPSGDTLGAWRQVIPKK
jgi:hypothetical protein